MGLEIDQISASFARIALRGCKPKIFQMRQMILNACLIAALGFVACNEQEPAGETTAATQTETDALLVNTQPASPGALSAQPASVAVQPATAAQQGAQQATQQASKGSTQAAKTAAGMNPPHGEPGHRCDIPVGAPLSTPAGATQATPTVQPVQATPAAAPAKPASSTGSGKLNPPHGEPGHDCAVPVGAPLK